MVLYIPLIGFGYTQEISEWLHKTSVDTLPNGIPINLYDLMHLQSLNVIQIKSAECIETEPESKGIFFMPPSPIS